MNCHSEPNSVQPWRIAIDAPLRRASFSMTPLYSYLRDATPENKGLEWILPLEFRL